MMVKPVFSAISTARLVVALRDTIAGIPAIRHFRTISDETLPELTANVLGNGTLFSRP